MDNNCVFCSIIHGAIPAKKLYEDDLVIAIYDIKPQTPVHFLVIPKVHISSANEITAENSLVIARVFEVIKRLAAEQGIDKNGYRVINNCGEYGGQTVDHIHFHVLGGTKLNEGLC